MSALARYFSELGYFVAGYDRTPSDITESLMHIGIEVCYDEELKSIPEICNDKYRCRVVYTPAVPEKHKQLEYFRNNGFEVMKRSDMLAEIAAGKKCVAVAGTHGKTSISTLAAWILNQGKLNAGAFLGGISGNFQSNLVLHNNSELVVMEADEYDRSFLKLFPDIALISYIDADHLDIYGNADNMENAYTQFANQTKLNGIVIIKFDIRDKLIINGGQRCFTYSFNDSRADFYASNITISKNQGHFELHSPFGNFNDITFPYAGKHHIENAVASAAIALCAGVNESHIRSAFSSFKGVKRRFEFIINSESLVYIDDYAHHPREIEATIDAARLLFPDRKITGIFQPHLFTRTRDFADEFASSLSKLDRLILLDIYPARELPIDGISSDIIISKLSIDDKICCSKNELLEIIKSESKIEVLITMGAGDIDRFVEPIRNILLNEK